MAFLHTGTALSCRALSGVSRSQTAAIARDGLPAAASRFLCGRTISSLTLYSLVIFISTAMFNNKTPYISHKLCFVPPLQLTATALLGIISTLFFRNGSKLFFSARYEVSRLQMIK